MQVKVGDLVEMKKQHPCGGTQFEVMRVGMDLRLRCTTCGTQVWLDRPKFNKAVKKIIPLSDGIQ